MMSKQKSAGGHPIKSRIFDAKSTSVLSYVLRLTSLWRKDNCSSRYLLHESFFISPQTASDRPRPHQRALRSTQACSTMLPDDVLMWSWFKTTLSQVGLTDQFSPTNVRAELAYGAKKFTRSKTFSTSHLKFKFLMNASRLP